MSGVPGQYFDQLIVEGQELDLGHLNPFHLLVNSKAANKTLRVDVRFSNHCFTQKHSGNEEIVVIKDGAGRDREYCPIRYRLSFQLPALIQSFNHEKAMVHQTWERRNWVYSTKIEDPEGPYYVFFELRRAPPVRRQWQDLELTVESAYHQDEEKEAPAMIGKVKFLLLCSNLYLNKNVATKR